MLMIEYGNLSGTAFLIELVSAITYMIGVVYP